MTDNAGLSTEHGLSCGVGVTYWGTKGVTHHAKTDALRHIPRQKTGIYILDRLGPVKRPGAARAGRLLPNPDNPTRRREERSETQSEDPIGYPALIPNLKSF